MNDLLQRVAAYGEVGAGHVELKFIAHTVPQLHDMIAAVAEGARLVVPAS